MDLTVADEIKIRSDCHSNREHPIELVPTFRRAHAIPPEYSGKTNEYVDLIVNEMLPEVSQKHIAEFCDVFTEEGIFSIEQSQKILKKAKKLELKIHIHADEIVRLRGAELAAELEAYTAGHLLQVSEMEIDALAKKTGGGGSVSKYAVLFDATIICKCP